MKTQRSRRIRSNAGDLKGLRFVLGVMIIISLQACAVIAVADAAVTVVATGVKLTAKAVGAVANAVIPDDD